MFALLLQSPSFTALGASLLSVSLIHPLLVGFLRNVVPSSWAVASRSTGKFPGISVERIALNNTTSKADLPSYYTTFLGTLIGWLAPLPFLYQDELTLSPQKSLSSIISTGFLILFSLILLIYRYLASQDSLIGIILGIGFGTIFGGILAIGLHYATQRRVTNLYSLPLLTTSYGGKTGQPIYVCASK